ncbi:DUF3617 domain-containing protein [Aurantiacibacter sp. D1-12]|uniref:DUF3617 domain-containing protein n=1 Tax=Aurantiacibacter sp. D1-12 TaxID=2993658 RepID=UPI00237C5BA8|nr:hypothetical protein [Aurantiacibacter sp. D1-12]MDE1468577.1 hypothetical protein [Aurantiacibacter sp. D1-12]
MNLKRTAHFIAGGIAAVFAVMPAGAQQSELAMLDSLDHGAWTLQLRGNDRSTRICVRTGREFIQLRHRQPGCEQFVVQDDPGEVTVQYTCRGNGYGRTTIRREGNGLVQVRSQGIQGGSPFSLEGEARRTGSC